MNWNMYRRHRLTALLLTAGFAVSLTALLIGISAVDAVLESLKQAGGEIPILDTMRNTGISLGCSIYLFSVSNCLVVTNYWILTRRRELAVCKAFGWSVPDLIRRITAEMAQILLVSFGVGLLLTRVLSRLTAGILSVRITPFFLGGTLLLLLVTLGLSAAIPAVRIVKLQPAEVIS